MDAHEREELPRRGRMVCASPGPVRRRGPLRAPEPEPDRAEERAAALRAEPEYAELRAAYPDLDEDRLLRWVDRLLGLTCGRCARRTRNNTQGHYWAWCRVTRTEREHHFCCPDDCALEAGPVGVYLGRLDGAGEQAGNRAAPSDRASGPDLSVSDSPKMLRETLCAAQSAVGVVFAEDPRLVRHVDRLQHLIDEVDRHRPLGPDGRHGDRHTATCGCGELGGRS